MKFEKNTTVASSSGSRFCFAENIDFCSQSQLARLLNYVGILRPSKLNLPDFYYTLFDSRFATLNPLHVSEKGEITSKLILFILARPCQKKKKYINKFSGTTSFLINISEFPVVVIQHKQIRNYSMNINLECNENKEYKQQENEIFYLLFNFSCFINELFILLVSSFQH